MAVNFQFYKNDATLSKGVKSGGCGLIPQLINTMVEQPAKAGSLYFHYHDGYHGDGAVHYVYVFEGKPPKSDKLHRVKLIGPNQGVFVSAGKPGGEISNANIKAAVDTATQLSNLAILKRIRLNLSLED